MNFQMFKLALEKAEIKLPTSVRSSKKQQSSRLTSTSALLSIPKPLPVWTTKKSGKFLEVRIASPGSMHGTGCLGLVHWDDPEGGYAEVGGRWVQDGGHGCTCGGFISMFGGANTIL